jgi:hypothetical protein
MGLLDDAIRDHIELKRRHGADPGEVARIESEALGPARREPVAALPYDATAEADADPGVPREHSGAVAAEAPPPEPPEPATEHHGAVRAGDAGVDAEQPAQPFDVEAAPESGDDVLEDTPEFLQETPEHDRLWFEQKPPKDFDF